MSDISKGDWADFLQHPCWKAFLEHTRGEWGAGGARFEGFMDSFADSRQDDALVMSQIRQIAVARREILRLIKWPDEELQRLRRNDDTVPMQGRPEMPQELAGQSRRGGL